MKLDPAIAALRSDRALQRRAQTAMVDACDVWRAEPDTTAVLAELDRFGEGAPLEACPRLDEAFTCQGAAEALTGTFTRRFAATLHKMPLGHLPLRHGFNGHSSTLLVARSGRAQLLLHAREPGSYSFQSITFSDALRYEAILAGSADARIARCCEAAGKRVHLWEEPVALASGARLGLDCTSEVLMIEQVTQRLVTLKLHRQMADPRPSTEYERTTGKLLHQACGDLRTSRQDMMVALIGRMGRTEAAPLLAAMAGEPGDTSLRWQALRECLTLDTAEGFRALVKVARRADDPLAADAGALRAQLVEAHPQLRQLEERPCPA